MKKTIFPALTACTLLLAACGGNPDASGPPILSITNSASPANSALGASEDASGDKMMWMGRQYFTADVNLPSLDSDAKSYAVSPSRVSKRDLNSLREVFALKDEFASQDANMGGGYLSGDYNTGISPIMYVSADAMHYWNYQAPWSNSTPAVACAVPSVSPGDTVSSVPPCATPAPPENVPTAGQAEELFKQMLKKLGLDTKDFITESYADEWNANVTGYLTIDGVRSSLSWSASYGADAKLTWASGALADITPAANYPRIGTAQGIARLNSNHSYGGGGSAVRGGVAYDDMTLETPGSTGAASSDVEPSPGGVVGGPVAVEPAIPGDTVSSIPYDQEMPVTEIKIVSVEEELVSLYGADGSIYLVPGYAFLAEKESGWTPRHVVSALPDEFVNDASGGDVKTPHTSVSEVPAPETIAPEINDQGNTAVDGVAVTQEDANTLLAQSESAAVLTATSNGWEVRVGQRDDMLYSQTKDYRQDRVTLTIIAGKVTKVDVG